MLSSLSKIALSRLPRQDDAPASLLYYSTHPPPRRCLIGIYQLPVLDRMLTMQKIAPYTVGEFVYTDTTGKQEKYLDYDANAVTYMLVNAVKEVDLKYSQQIEAQQQQLTDKDAQLASQQQQITVLQNEMLQIKALLHQSVAASSTEVAQLWQNEPNPTDGTAIIRYRIPLSAVSARITLFSTNGQELQSFEISQRGEGSLSIAAGSLATGTYVYRLIVDGKAVASKKLVMIR